MTDTVLRVLSGRLAGAEKAVEPGAHISIGYQFWQDITLREPGVRGIAAEIALADDGRAQIAVLSGQVSILGSKVEAGAGAILPAYVPVSLGGVAIAWGDRDSARWQEARQLADAIPMPPPPPPTRADQALAIAGHARAGAERFLSGWRLAAIGGCAVLLAGAAAVGPAADALGLRADEVHRVSLTLDESGLRGLKTMKDPTSGGVIVTGVVPDEGGRVRAQQALDTAHVPGTVDVRTTGELASAAAEVARLHGLEASARPLGRAQVELHTTALQPDERAALVRAVQGDVGGIERLALVDDLVPSDEAPVRSVADATKKVSTVVAGDPAYIRTQDGARYFAGAMMPSGHRLVAIKDQTVVLEKNGRETRLTF